MAHQNRGWLLYGSDAQPFSGVNFSIKAHPSTASNNGQTMSETPSIFNFWPSHTSDMRHVYGIDATGVFKTSCIATGTASPIWLLGASFSDGGGNSYSVIGLKPEHVRTRNLK